MKYKILLSAISALALSACGGTQGSQAFEEQVESAELSDAAEIPTSGTASYQGAVEVTLGEGFSNGGVDGYGKVAMTTDFATNSVTGSMDQFTAGENGDEFDGSLSIAASYDQKAADPKSSIIGTLSGRLEQGSDSLTVDGDLSAGFYGDTGDIIKGNAEGQAELVQNGQSGSTSFTAEFAATE